MSSAEALTGVFPLSSYASLLAVDQMVLDAMPSAIYVSASDGTVVRYNRRATELWRRTPRPGDTHGRLCGSFRLYRTNGQALPDASVPVDLALRTGEPQWDQEVGIERPDGSRIVALLNIDVLKDSAGRIEGTISSLKDITKRKQAEDEAEKARADLQDFFDSALAAMHWVGADGTILKANEAELQLLGYSREEYLERNIADFHVDEPRTKEILACLKTGESLSNFPARLRAKDGSIKHVRISSRARIRDGEFMHTRCVTFDVTDAVRTAELLGESERRYRELLEALPAAVYTTDAAGRITYFNEAAAEFWGCRPELGKSEWCGSWKLYHPDGTSMPHDQCPMALALRDKRPIRGKRAIAERPDGTRLHFAPYPTPIFDSSGTMVGAVNMLVDTEVEQSLAIRMAEQAALFDFTDALYRAESHTDVYESAVNAILAALRCDRASILMFDESNVMRFVAWRGLSDPYRRAVEGHSPWAADAVDPQPVSIADVDEADIPDALRGVVKSEGIRALSFIPVMAGGRLGGKFMTYYDRPHSFTGAELGLALILARQLGFSIERQRAEEARIRAEEERRKNEERERQRAAELQAVMEAVPAMIWITHDQDARVITGNPASRAFLRLHPDASPSLSAPDGESPTHFEAMTDGRVLRVEELPVQRAARGEEVRNFELQVRFDDGTSSYLFGNATPFHDAEGRPNGGVAAFVDITERKRADSQRDFLVQELSHRVKNTLATVISIQNQSFAKAASPEDARTSFANRIRALAQTHGRLAEGNWAGVSLETMLGDEIAPYRHEDGDNLQLSGPQVMLNAKSALTLGMAIHELVTNAAKYGALSRKGGRVAIVWESDARQNQLRIRWKETGGPSVVVPRRSGFGRLLLERVLTADLGGTAQLQFAPEGLTCDITIPLTENIADST
jgi:PAS domain S-box-containing protein